MLAVAVVALLVAACSDGADDEDVAANEDPVSTAETTIAESDEGTAAPGSSTTTAATTTTQAAASPTDRGPTTLPGVAADGPFLPAGTILAVIGVEADDVLQVRAGPGVDQPILDSLEPLATGLIATGRARSLSGSLWYEVDTGVTTGWVNSRFVDRLSATFDITQEVLAAAGEAPTGTTIGEIGERVVELRSAGADPRPSGVIVDGPTAGDLEEITYDLIGFGDDSVAGERLHLFAQVNPDTGLLELRTVEVTYICVRGSGVGQDLCP